MKVNMYRKNRSKRYLVVISLLLASVLLNIGVAFADTQNLSSVATTITASFSDLAKLITAIAYIAGLGFAVGAIFKFKSHKDNPTQIPIGAPITLLFVGAALIFMPNVFGVAGKTVFGTTTNAGGATGKDPFST
jgi:intracellular multiplication protein IcmD